MDFLLIDKKWGSFLWKEGLTGIDFRAMAEADTELKPGAS